MRRSTRADWLREPEHPEPAHDEATRYVPAPPKIQAAMQQASAAFEQTRKARELMQQPEVRSAMRTAAKYAPMIAKTSKVIREAQQHRRAERYRRMRGRSRAPRRGTCRRAGSRRASGIRTGQDPGDPDLDEPPSRSIAAPPRLIRKEAGR